MPNEEYPYGDETESEIEHMLLYHEAYGAENPRHILGKPSAFAWSMRPVPRLDSANP